VPEPFFFQNLANRYNGLALWHRLLIKKPVPESFFKNLRKRYNGWSNAITVGISQLSGRKQHINLGKRYNEEFPRCNV